MKERNMSVVVMLPVTFDDEKNVQESIGSGGGPETQNDTKSNRNPKNLLF